MDEKTKKWIILFGALFIAGCGAFLLLKSLGTGGAIAKIYVDGELIESIDLNAVVLPYEFTVESPRGYNKVLVEHGRISVIEADCPDHLCIKQGAIETDAIPIVCLPHRLVIMIEGVSP
ncbi:MAG: NusG domain II-containing protein [Oscillospiraceae bacterium]|jgi:hypothetical protein